MSDNSCCGFRVPSCGLKTGPFSLSEDTACGAKSVESEEYKKGG